MLGLFLVSLFLQLHRVPMLGFWLTYHSFAFSYPSFSVMLYVITCSLYNIFACEVTCPKKYIMLLCLKRPWNKREKKAYINLIISFHSTTMKVHTSHIQVIYSVYSTMDVFYFIMYKKRQTAEFSTKKQWTEYNRLHASYSLQLVRRATERMLQRLVVSLLSD